MTIVFVRGPSVNFQLIEGHWLVLSAVLAINGDSFATKSICQFIGLVNGGDGGLFAEVNGFADRCVAVLLKGGLHLNMPFGLNIVSGFEDPSYFGRDLGDFLYGAGFGNSLLKLFAVEALLFGYLFENRIYLEQF